MNGWMVKGSLGKIDGDKLADEVRGLFGRDNRTHAVLAAFRTALGSVPRNGLIGKRHKINRATLNRLKLRNWWGSHLGSQLFWGLLHVSPGLDGSQPPPLPDQAAVFPRSDDSGLKYAALGTCLVFIFASCSFPPPVNWIPGVFHHLKLSPNFLLSTQSPAKLPPNQLKNRMILQQAGLLLIFW